MDSNRPVSAAGRAPDGRWWRRLLRRSQPVELDPARPDLTVVAAGFDEVESCAAALERSVAGVPGWRDSEQAVLRHHLCVPTARVAEVTSIAAQDGYSAAPADAPGASETIVPRADEVVLVLQRVQVLDALHCAQERSRMAGLAQRHDGRAVGWDALQPGAGD